MSWSIHILMGITIKIVVKPGLCRWEAHIVTYRACCHVSLYATLVLNCGAHSSSDCIIRVNRTPIVRAWFLVAYIIFREQYMVNRSMGLEKRFFASHYKRRQFWQIHSRCHRLIHRRIGSVILDRLAERYACHCMRAKRVQWYNQFVELLTFSGKIALIS